MGISASFFNTFAKHRIIVPRGMLLKFLFSITFVIDVRFIRPILYGNRYIFGIFFGLLKLLKNYPHICNFPKSKFPKLSFTNSLKNAADMAGCVCLSNHISIFGIFDSSMLS